MQKEHTCLVLATTNEGKKRELREPIEALGLTLKSLADYPELGPLAENGTTFAQNALAKARAVARYTKTLALADDSGLEVDALGGRPGIYSARFGSDLALLANESKDARNIRKLLAEMEGVPHDSRTCRFVCSMALVRPDGREMTLEASWEGEVLTEPLGSQGFGYDPIFFDPALGTSAAMLSPKEKNLVSHRGKALRLLLARLPHFLDLPTLTGEGLS